MKFSFDEPVGRFLSAVCVVWIALTLSAATAAAQQVPADPQDPPTVVSPELMSGGRIAFRIFAPDAKSVELVGFDLGAFHRRPLTKGENGVWEIIVGPMASGAYRYRFRVDGVDTVDPWNPATSDMAVTALSLVYVPGSDLWDAKDVPHGTVGAITYKSSSLERSRRMHVYTPPGYESGTGRYPVLYLLHGGLESDASWVLVGRANFILDNLIAAKKARPMIVVMPALHGRSPRINHVDFFDDFTEDIVPYVERHYRVLTGPNNTAIAGASVGGTYTLHLAFAGLDHFGYIGVLSSGLSPGEKTWAREQRTRASVSGHRQGPTIQYSPYLAEWERWNAAALDNATLKKNISLLWFATGTDDSVFLPSARATAELLRKHGFAPIQHETNGAHNWMVWRGHLADFAPRLFRQ